MMDELTNEQIAYLAKRFAAVDQDRELGMLCEDMRTAMQRRKDVVAREKKYSKEESEYVELHTRPMECGRCRHFIHQEGEMSRCWIVEGRIDPKGICKYHSPVAEVVHVPPMKWDVALMRQMAEDDCRWVTLKNGNRICITDTHGGHKWGTKPKRAEPSEEDRQVERFTRRETPAERKKRIKSIHVDPDREEVLRRAMGFKTKKATEHVLHLGPGDHPSGSPQDVHGHGGGGSGESTAGTDTRTVSRRKDVPGSVGKLATSRGSDSENDPPLSGLPTKIKVPGLGTVSAGPFKTARRAAAAYMKAAGLEYNPPKTYAKVDPERASRIAQAYDEMRHDPQNPEVKAAYKAMIDETLAQYQEIKKTGLKVEAIDFAKTGDPYAASPRLATLDVINNNHLWFFRTKDGFGSDQTFDASDNPLLAETDEEINGEKLLANDVFRIVHDYFGHVKEGVGFRADGEENAWRSHSAMYSPLARRAMTSETRGQNSWVNYGPHGEKNRTASSAETVFADQKTGLLPDWVIFDGADDVIEEGQKAAHEKWDAEMFRLHLGPGDHPSGSSQDAHGHGGGGGGTPDTPSGKPKAWRQPAPKDFIAARNKSTRVAYMAPLKPEDLTSHRLYTMHNDTVGFALDTAGDIQNVFNNGGPRGAGIEAMFSALEQGGRTLDCYDGYLPDFYAQFGFVETGRMRFNPEFAPPGWNFERDGQPDVVFMAWKGFPDDIEAVRELLKDRTKWREHADATKYYDDWDEAKEDARRAAGVGSRRQTKRPGVDREARELGVGTGEGDRRTLTKWDIALYDWALHLGPGSHPSGSPQDVHGHGGGGDDQNPDEVFKSRREAAKDTRPWHEVGTVEEAYERLTKGQRVILQQAPMVSTLLDRLATAVEEAKRTGQKLTINLCDVSVRGTNIFCAENVGISRIEMPQLAGEPIKGSPADKLPRNAIGEVNLGPLFREHLEKTKGIDVKDQMVQASFLKASQRELSGTSVAGIVKLIESGKLIENPVFVSRDNYIIDGHHRWAAQVTIDYRRHDDFDKPMKVAKVDASILEVLIHAWKFAKGMGMPTAAMGSTDVAKVAKTLSEYELAADPDEDCHWVTLDNGAKVCIQDSSGKIVKGPDALVGKTKEEATGKSAQPETTKKKKKTPAAQVEPPKKKDEPEKTASKVDINKLKIGEIVSGKDVNGKHIKGEVIKAVYSDADEDTPVGVWVGDKDGSYLIPAANVQVGESEQVSFDPKAVKVGDVVSVNMGVKDQKAWYKGKVIGIDTKSGVVAVDAEDLGKWQGPLSYIAEPAKADEFEAKTQAAKLPQVGGTAHWTDVGGAPQSGKIVAVNEKSVTIEESDGETFSVPIKGATKFDPPAPVDVKVGDKITFTNTSGETVTGEITGQHSNGMWSVKHATGKAAIESSQILSKVKIDLDTIQPGDLVEAKDLAGKTALYRVAGVSKEVLVLEDEKSGTQFEVMKGKDVGLDIVGHKSVAPKTTTTGFDGLSDDVVSKVQVGQTIQGNAGDKAVTGKVIYKYDDGFYVEAKSGEVVNLSKENILAVLDGKPVTHAQALEQAGWKETGKPSATGNTVYAHPNHSDQAIVVSPTKGGWAHWNHTPEDLYEGTFHNSIGSGSSVDDLAKHLGLKTGDGQVASVTGEIFKDTFTEDDVKDTSAIKIKIDGKVLEGKVVDSWKGVVGVNTNDGEYYEVNYKDVVSVTPIASAPESPAEPFDVSTVKPGDNLVYLAGSSGETKSGLVIGKEENEFRVIPERMIEDARQSYENAKAADENPFKGTFEEYVQADLQQWTVPVHEKLVVDAFVEDSGVDIENFVPKNEADAAHFKKLQMESVKGFQAVDMIAEKLTEVPSVDVDEEGDGGFTDADAEEWDQLSSDAQSKTEEMWVDNSKSDFVDSEIENWQENLKETVPEEMQKDSDFLRETINEILVLKNPSVDDLADNPSWSYRFNLIPASIEEAFSEVEVDKDGNLDMGSVDISKLEYVQGDYVEGQGVLPGIDEDVLRMARKQSLWGHIEGDFLAEFKQAWEREYEKRTSDAETPDWVYESAAESASEYWNDLDDKEKFKYWENNVKDEDDGGSSSESDMVAPPKVFRVVRDGEDYNRTRSFARALTEQRTAQLLQERGIKVGSPTKIAKEIWDDWKSDSHTRLALSLQYAAALELGSLHRLTADQIATAKSQAANVGGIEAVKAYVRAQWEVSQYILKKANVKHLDVYRAVMLAPDVVEKTLKVKVKGYTKLPKLPLQKNGAASFTTMPSVANDWDGIGKHKPKKPTRVVLRAKVPATAIVSLPVYGQNVHSEEETVVIGTPWYKWEAWHKTAPSVDEIKLAEGLVTQDDSEPEEGEFVIDLNDPAQTGPGHWLTHPDRIRKSGTTPEVPQQALREPVKWDVSLVGQLLK